MQSQMVEEIVDEMQNQRHKRTHVNGTDEEDNQEENSGIEGRCRRDRRYLDRLEEALERPTRNCYTFVLKVS